MNEQAISTREALSRYAPYNRAAVKSMLEKMLEKRKAKVIVLDDDPTGIQTVHDIYVYTDWTIESFRAGFAAPQSMFFILTNSRGMSSEETEREHRAMARNIAQAAKEAEQDFILISRSDSTLRGYYPLETEVLRDTLEGEGLPPYDGEVILPFFLEGGRFTIDDVHYVQMGETLVPAGQTEFAKDRTFGYTASNLRRWVEEKTQGRYRAQDVASVTLDQLRSCRTDEIVKVLMGVHAFGKVIVNAIDYPDVEMFVIALIGAMEHGKRFLFRSAAALTKVLGGVSDKELLTREELVNTQNRNGGLIVVGSHVHKTTLQLEQLRRAQDIDFIEFNVRTVLDDAAFAAEQARIISAVEKNIRAGKTTAVYTSRERLDLGEGRKQEELMLSVKISGAVSGIVSALTVQPNFIIAKGGITSSDVGTKGLGVRRAKVMGQILKCIPVWLTGEESKFPDMPYVIFPGNVGDENALYDAYMKVRP